MYISTNSEFNIISLHLFQMFLFCFVDNQKEEGRGGRGGGGEEGRKRRRRGGGEEEGKKYNYIATYLHDRRK